MKKREPFLPPQVRQTTTLELEDCLLGTSKLFVPYIEATGHGTESLVIDETGEYWENN